jgi:hypothetical protein
VGDTPSYRRVSSRRSCRNVAALGTTSAIISTSDATPAVAGCSRAWAIVTTARRCVIHEWAGRLACQPLDLCARRVLSRSHLQHTAQRERAELRIVGGFLGSDGKESWRFVKAVGNLQCQVLRVVTNSARIMHGDCGRLKLRAVTVEIDHHRIQAGTSVRLRTGGRTEPCRPFGRPPERLWSGGGDIASREAVPVASVKAPPRAYPGRVVPYRFLSQLPARVIPVRRPGRSRSIRSRCSSSAPTR